MFGMNKQETYLFLKEQGIYYEVIEHQAVFTMEESNSVYIPYPEGDAKNLFVRDDKKRNYYLITVKGDKRVDLKEFRKTHGLRSLSLGSAEELMSLLGILPGAVTPLGLLNDVERKVVFYLDEAFMGGMIAVHPNDNTATVWMKTEDLIRILKEHGSIIHIVEMIG